MEFLRDIEYECPYCHGQLEDVRVENDWIKICHSDVCNDRKFQVFTTES